MEAPPVWPTGLGVLDLHNTRFVEAKRVATEYGPFRLDEMPDQMRCVCGNGIRAFRLGEMLDRGRDVHAPHPKNTKFDKKTPRLTKVRGKSGNFTKTQKLTKKRPDRPTGKIKKTQNLTKNRRDLTKMPCPADHNKKHKI